MCFGNNSDFAAEGLPSAAELKLQLDAGDFRAPLVVEALFVEVLFVGIGLRSDWNIAHKGGSGLARQNCRA